MIRIKPAKIIFILISAIYYNTIMFAKAPYITYIYYYFIAFLYLLINNKWLFSKINEIRKKGLAIVFLFFLLQIIGSLLVPLFMRTNDFSYLTGPLLQIIKFLIAYMFLLCMYEKWFGKEDNSGGFLDTFVYAIVCYVVGTLIICVIPPLHQWIIDNMWSNEYTAWLIRQSDAYTRIGWSGFSNFFPTIYCSLAVIICLTNLLSVKCKRDRFLKYNILALICLVGNFCYGRIGVIVSVLAYLMYFIVLLRRRPGKILIYPIIMIVVVVIGGILISRNQKMMNWFNWAFAQILQFRKTGSFATYTITSLKEMYVMPSLDTFLIGDGLYKGVDTEYYMSIDVGWLRPIYFYGIIFSSIGFLSAMYVIRMFSVQVYKGNGTQKFFSYFSLIIGYILFESKGEVFHIFISIFIVFLLTNRDKRIILATY